MPVSERGECERGINQERDGGCPGELHDTQVLPVQIFHRDGQEGYRKDRDQGIEEIIDGEIIGNLGEEEEDHPGPPQHPEVLPGPDREKERDKKYP